MGAEHPFVIWTDHRIWSISDHPNASIPVSLGGCCSLGGLNSPLPIAPDPAMSNPMPFPVSSPPTSNRRSQKTILPYNCMVSSLTIEKSRVWSTVPRPAARPPNSLFMPDSVRFQVLQWVQSSRISCHSGTAHTLEVLKRKFWWPTMDSDTREFFISLVLGFFNLSRSLNSCGHTVILTNCFPKWPNSSLWPSNPPLRRLPKPWPIKYLGSTASLRT